MRVAIIAVCLLAMAWPIRAADLTCTVPPGAAVTKAIELCEVLRLRLSVRAADWDNDVCATEFLRIGLETGERTRARNEAAATTRTVVRDAVAAFRADHPPSVASAFCGDTIVDVEFGEECDDGNDVDGDGCSVDCQTE